MGLIHCCSLRLKNKSLASNCYSSVYKYNLVHQFLKRMDINPKKLCQVCGCVANQNRIHSQHYGAICCNNCRSFFRRTMQLHGTENMSTIYSCDSKTKGQNCDMKEFGKKHRCAKCRLLKCIEVGMNPNRVITDPAFRDKFKGKNT